jgi:ABC-type long-subunit fatty acid transport system fused permease/ATPase subunit
MFTEFFLSGTRVQRLGAWGGLAWYALHSGYKIWVKYRINNWYSTFYDLLQKGAEDIGSGSGDTLETRQDEVREALVEFAAIVIPNIVAHPLLRLVQNVWILNWRCSTTRVYLDRWKAVGSEGSIEGAAQRVHEDARLFTDGIGGIVGLFIDSIATVAVFAPILYELGGAVVPLGFESDELRSEWLLEAVLLAAASGTLVTWLVGRRLVCFEIDLQRAEATLRTLLVWLESAPELIVAHLRSHAVPPPVEAHASTGDVYSAHTLTPVKTSLSGLWWARVRLLLSLSGVSLWLGIFQECAVLAPYFLAAPLLFADDPARRITLGTLVQMSNAFGKLVDALAVVAENYAELNAFAAVVVRLREFERAQRGSVARRALLAPADASATGVELGPACASHEH